MPLLKNNIFLQQMTVQHTLPTCGTGVIYPQLFILKLNQQYYGTRKNWLELISETAAYITEKVGEMPKTAIILGTGLGELVKHIDIKVAIPYSEIPNFPVSTVEGHSGRLIFGNLGSKYIMAMQGRFHFYEGYSMKEATFPVRVMNKLGVKTLSCRMQQAV